MTCQGPFSTTFSSHKKPDGTDGSKTPFVLGGGAGFGGKSYVLRTAAVELNATLRELGINAPWGMIFCRTYPDLSDRQIRPIQNELRDLGRIRKTTIGGLFFEFYDPSLGGFYLRNVGDGPSPRKGSEFDYILGDELTEFQRAEVDAVLYTLRSGRNLPFKTFAAATNPDGIGHGWVKAWWIDRDFSGEQTLLDAGVLHPEDFVFVPFKPQDNPTFDTSVQARLMGFEDRMLVKARWEGSWDLALGNRFSQFRRDLHLFEWEDFEATYGYNVPHMRILKNQDIMYVYGSLDYGTDTNAASAFYLHAVDTKQRVWTFHELYMQGMFLDQQAEMIKPLIQDYGPVRIFCDPSLLGTDSDGISRFVKFRRHGIILTPGINDRIEGWSTMDSFLHFKLGADGLPVIAPKWRIHSSCRHLLKFLGSAPRDDIRPEDVSRRFKEDHAGDSTRYFIHSYFKKPREITDNPLEGVTAHQYAKLRKRNKTRHEQRWL